MEKMKKTKNQESESDRLTSLPESLMHHIFSFIDIRHAIQMSVLSTDWRYFWKFLPTINISFDSLRFETDQNFIHNVLTLHEASHVHTFSLKSDFHHLDVEIIFKILLTRHAEKVHIRGKCIKMSKSALELFLLQSKHVETLKLRYLYLSGKGQRQVDLRSSTLENLVLWCYEICENVTIDCPRLDYLKFVNDNQFINFKPLSIMIHAPRLSRIHIQGGACDYSLEGPSSMLDAHVEIFDDTDMKLFSKYLDSLLRVLVNAKSLTLNAYMFQECGDLLIYRDEVDGIQFLWDAVRVSFPNLKYLKVVEWSSKTQIKALAKFIELFSSIETLVMESNEDFDTGSSDEEYSGIDWDTHLDFRSSYHELKSFDIQFIEGVDNVLMFIDYIMRSAPALEKINITMGKAPANAKLKFIKKVESLPSYSSKVTVSVRERNIALSRYMEETEMESESESESENYMDNEEENTSGRGEEDV